jgi:hypothetical protein
MSFPSLDRRTLLRSGATAACFTFTGLGIVPAVASPGATLVPVTGPLAGWLVLASEGGGRLTLMEVDAQSRPARLVAVETIPALASIADAARHASAAIVGIVANSWQVSASDCTCRLGRIDHSHSGRSVSLAIWTDFA